MVSNLIKNPVNSNDNEMYRTHKRLGLISFDMAYLQASKGKFDGYRFQSNNTRGYYCTLASDLIRKV